MWFALDITVDGAAREAVEYALTEAGASGTETTAGEDAEVARVAGYFDRAPEREAVRASVLDALRIYGLPPASLRAIEAREVEARDWLGEWKKSWQPVAVGARFVVAPPWGEVEERPGRVVIRIEPGMAFGTGTHETTRLCLVALEKYFAGDGDGSTSFLDVGTGTGILAIAAAKLDARARVEACDTDAEAVEIARENASLNGVAAQINFRTGTVEAAGASYDCVCANLTADVILPLLPALIGATCGRLILSGILDTQAASVRARLAQLGISETETASDGEWVAIIV
ncbi:MAG: ribosomal protein methyltransferase [Pyrinomonadaceae bacterium]|jgi:ribosomal protein L11 methyltransferase|nr:ribosomal protein methyltransferase [Pyrinomonadaceae bacterium]